jgi:hypothetical protein
MMRDEEHPDEYPGWETMGGGWKEMSEGEVAEALSEMFLGYFRTLKKRREHITEIRERELFLLVGSFVVEVEQLPIDVETETIQMAVGNSYIRGMEHCGEVDYASRPPDRKAPGYSLVKDAIETTVKARQPGLIGSTERESS